MNTDAERRLARLQRLAKLLDSSARIPGTKVRIGVDALIGLIPVAGDAAGAAVSAYIVHEAMKLGLPRRTIARMLVNVGIELLVGSIPVVGDLFDVAFHANVRNVALAARALADRAQDARELSPDPRSVRH